MGVQAKKIMRNKGTTTDEYDDFKKPLSSDLQTRESVSKRKKMIMSDEVGEVDEYDNNPFADTAGGGGESFVPGETFFEGKGGEQESFHRRRVEDIYQNDDGEIDLEREHAEMLAEIRRQSSTSTPDFAKMIFTNLENPNKDYVLVRDPATNDEMTVAKSASLVKFQKELAKRKMPTELEKLTPYYSPTKGRLRSQSRGNQSGTSWLSFEQMMKI